MTHAKKTPKPPKARNVWAINPKTRVKESDKAYSRPRERGAARRSLQSPIDWFGEKGT